MSSEPYRVSYAFITECGWLHWPENGSDELTVEQEGARLDLENRLKEFGRSAHHSALSSLASEVRELVGGVQDMLHATEGDPEGGTTWWASQRLRLALSAPGIQKLLSRTKENAALQTSA